MKVIIDCDPGVDDMEAIFMALGSKHVELIALTTITGNTDCNQVYTNSIDILTHCNITDIPIYKGPVINMSGNSECTNHYFGLDGLGNANLKHYENYKQEKMSSAEALHYYVNKYPGEINLIAIGPLTNLAIAYLLDNSFPKKLKSLVVMGGDRQETTYGNITPFAEFNTHSDIFAWKLVMEQFYLSNDETIKLVDLKTCQDHFLPPNFLDKFYGRDRKDTSKFPKGHLLALTYDHMSKKFNEKGRITCDPIASLVNLYPQYKFEGKRIILQHITLDGEAVGHTVFKDSEKGNIFLVEKIDLENYLDILYKTTWLQ